jgi:hypothetical protein
VRPALRCGHQQSLGQCLEIEPAIESAGEGAEVLRCVLSKLKFLKISRLFDPFSTFCS